LNDMDFFNGLIRELALIDIPLEEGRSHGSINEACPPLQN